MVHIDFERFMADQTGTIVKVLQYAGLSTSDEVVAAVKYYVEASPRKGISCIKGFSSYSQLYACRSQCSQLQL